MRKGKKEKEEKDKKENKKEMLEDEITTKEDGEESMEIK